MDVDDAKKRFSRASWANVLGNAIKIVVEGAAGVTFGSVALVADAAHSVADLVASVVVLVWGSSSYDNPDDSHPHGHERIEPLTALFVGAVIVLLGLNLLYESTQGIIEGGTGVRFSYLLLGALAFALVDMYLVYWYTMRQNESLGSTALAALAADCLNDLYTTVAAIIGVLGVLIGYPILDSIAGGLVSLLVVYQGVDIGRENLDYLVGAAPTGAKRDEIRERIKSHPGVEGLHDLTVFYDGTVLEVEVHVEVDGEMTIREAHDLESELVDSLRAVKEVGDAHIHLDPSGLGEWKEAVEGDSL
ncbi:cation diffusion facilitator family transporter [Halohasta litchfieldiae]|jgi:cation diffusion facilitator family transporter|uniref:Cation diffusion facilitator family transporter n=1 Tax=Halohasta litchfieldiae TaxID=1073996 RepID=A0A1H6WJW5_9EURY|nr:cation diffusion facilitator family transporter [Halohasta litchfieldiae]ATW90121.1 cation diffusion facilitator family transporter [Halohasta litchfieldiae]SEJ16016.1 cation diffusion facilitator family transporter [Halohasta litchfieldiae]